MPLFSSFLFSFFGLQDGPTEIKMRNRINIIVLNLEMVDFFTDLYIYFTTPNLSMLYHVWFSLSVLKEIILSYLCNRNGMSTQIEADPTALNYLKICYSWFKMNKQNFILLLVGFFWIGANTSIAIISLLLLCCFILFESIIFLVTCQCIKCRGFGSILINDFYDIWIGRIFIALRVSITCLAMLLAHVPLDMMNQPTSRCFYLLDDFESYTNEENYLYQVAHFADFIIDDIFFITILFLESSSPGTLALAITPSAMLSMKRLIIS